MSSVTEPRPHKADPEKKRAASGRTSLHSARRSLHPQFEQAGKEKAKAVLLAQAPRGVASTKFQDKANAHRVVKRSSVTLIPLKGSKPWPGSGTKTADDTDELIKHMSNVPSYLQRATHNGDNIQGKALNVGVLEWNALERYTSKKHLAYGTAKVASPSSSHGTAPPPNKQQSANPFVDSDTEYSSSVMHYRRSFSQRKSKDTPNEEEMHGERSRAATKFFTSNGSPLQGGQIKKIPSRFSGELSVDPQAKYHHTPVPFSCGLHREGSGIGAIAATTTTAGSGGSTSTSSNGSSLLRENAKAVSRGLTGLNQNELSLGCSLKELSSDSGPPLVNSRGKMSNVESTEREAASSKRGRQSPLRRMLDPLLKAKNAASASVSASHHESTPVGLRRPVDSRIGLSRKKEHLTGTGTCAENDAVISTPSFQPSTRQALLQLAWKAGLPVFMLSSGESDILGATLRKKCTSDTADNPDISYSIFTLQESKTKGGATWIRPGNKGEKQHLVSNIVGEVRVSTCKSKCRNNSDLYHVSREFVLVGPQLVPNAKTERPISDTEIDSPVNHELAAIVTNLPTSNCLCSKMDSAGSMTAILPSGIHGSSTQGEPSSLIERWWSGGGCDCGGWDEGCRLSLLSLEFPEGSKSNWEDSQVRFELFPQGCSKGGGHAFSMICFKEGLYTVEIKSSIPLLQAFAICISLLHCRSPLKHEMQQDKTLEVRNGGPPTSYMQCHPPLSPVGRA